MLRLGFLLQVLLVFMCDCSYSVFAFNAVLPNLTSSRLCDSHDESSLLTYELLGGEYTVSNASSTPKNGVRMTNYGDRRTDEDGHETMGDDPMQQIGHPT